jgi:hypothetical protein
MKRILIVRLPSKYPPDILENISNRIKKEVGEDATVVVIAELGIEKSEFEIVYDPHLKPEYQINYNTGPAFDEGSIGRVFNQVDTSTNAYMDKKPDNE